MNNSHERHEKLQCPALVAQEEVGIPTLVHYNEYDLLYASQKMLPGPCFGTARQPPIDFSEWHATGS